MSNQKFRSSLIIKLKLAQKGFRLIDVDEKFNLSPGTAQTALKRPHKKAEKCIAQLLREHPKDLWPNRYDKKGNRLKPQPKENYFLSKSQ